MRTLQSQMRLRRLVRIHSDFAVRLMRDPEDRVLAGAAADRLLQLAADLRAAWEQESAQGPTAPVSAGGATWLGAQAGGTTPAALRRHVSRAIARIEAAAGAMDRPGADQPGLAAEFEEAALPLIFCLRGLEQVPAAHLGDLAMRELGRSA
ncbi:MAG: hypothetical protein ACREPI_13120 [Candidatus Dormibacterales bacterium]